MISSRPGKAASPSPHTKAEFTRRFAGDLPEGFDAAISAYKKKLAETKPTIATRKASEDALEVINGFLPETLGGSADLTPSNNTKTSQMHSITPTDFAGRYMHWGIREHGMASAMNGIALHGGLIPYGGGFLIFSDYCRPPIRLAALMGIRVIHVLTHDSIGVGEDGPTHQPVEQIAGLRAVPNLLVFRPADATETAECWQIAIKTKNRPSGLALTRQNLTPVRTEYSEKNLCEQGAYTLAGNADAKVTIFASGSEVELARCRPRNAGSQGRQHPRRIRSLHRTVLRAAGSLPQGSHRQLAGQDRRRSRRPRGLGCLHRSGRQLRRHEGLRRVRPGQGSLQAFRHHRGRRGRCRRSKTHKRAPQALSNNSIVKPHL